MLIALSDFGTDSNLSFISSRWGKWGYKPFEVSVVWVTSLNIFISFKVFLIKWSSIPCYSYIDVCELGFLCDYSTNVKLDIIVSFNWIWVSIGLALVDNEISINIYITFTPVDWSCFQFTCSLLVGWLKEVHWCRCSHEVFDVEYIKLSCRCSCE